MKFPLVLRKTLNKALTQVSITLDDNLRLNLQNSDLRLKLANLEGSNKGLLELNAELEKKLKVALKNDKRGAKGRYTKA